MCASVRTSGHCKLAEPAIAADGENQSLWGEPCYDEGEIYHGMGLSIRTYRESCLTRYKRLHLLQMSKTTCQLNLVATRSHNPTSPSSET